MASLRTLSAYGCLLTFASLMLACSGDSTPPIGTGVGGGGAGGGNADGTLAVFDVDADIGVNSQGNSNKGV